MADPQEIVFPDRQPYEGTVVERNDPLGMHRVKILIPGPWDPYGPWVPPIGVGYSGGLALGRFESPPLGANVLVFFVNGNKENPRYLAGDFSSDGLPLDGSGNKLAEVTDDGDNKVFQDERIRVEVDARDDTYGIRITDVERNVSSFVDIDLYGGQLGVSTQLGILLKTTGHCRIEAGLVTINGRPVVPSGDPI